MGFNTVIHIRVDHIPEPRKTETYLVSNDPLGPGR